MFRSVHDHSYGRNRAYPGGHGAAERRGGLHVHRDRAGGVQPGPLGAPYDMAGPDERAGVDGPPRARPGQTGERLGEDRGAGARRMARPVPGLVGHHQVPGVHPGGQAGAESGGDDGGAGRAPAGRAGLAGLAERARHRALGGLRPHAGAQHGHRPGGRAEVAAAQGEPLDAERAGDQQRRRARTLVRAPVRVRAFMLVRGRAGGHQNPRGRATAGSPLTYRPSAVTGKTCRYRW